MSIARLGATGERARSTGDLPARLALEALPFGVLLATEDGMWANHELHRIWHRPETSPFEPDTVLAALTPVPNRARPTLTVTEREAADDEAALREDAAEDRRTNPAGDGPLAGSPWIASGRYTLRRADGTTGVVRVDPRRLVDEDGRTIGMLTVIADETAAAESERLRDAFLGILGHELRTPITSIVGGSELLRADGLDGDIRREVATSLAEEADWLNHLVDQLIRLATLDRGGSAAEPVHLGHVVRRAIQRERTRFPRLRVEAAVDGQVPPASGDEGFIGEVLTILLDNAAKYAGPASHVTIVVTAGPSVARVHVLDEGPGVPIGSGDIFGLFQRGHADAGARTGTGIGLFVARAIVEMLGGRIWATNRPEGGADVAFELPLAES